MEDEQAFRLWAMRVKGNVDYFSERAKGYSWNGQPLTEKYRNLFRERLAEALEDWELACAVARRNGIDLSVSGDTVQEMR